MADLEKARLVSSARFAYGSQQDLVGMIRLMDPASIELSLRFKAVTSTDFQQLYSKLQGVRSPSLIDLDYADNVLRISDPERTFPVDDPINFLPAGIQRFVGDLDRLIELAHKERVFPLLSIVRDGEFACLEPKIQQLSIRFPQVILEGEKHEDNSRIGYIVKEKVYGPRIQRLMDIEGFVRGWRPHFVAYCDLRRNPKLARGCIAALDTVPGENTIDFFKIGSEPREVGRGDYYDWKYASVIEMWGGNTFFDMKFNQPVDAAKVEEDFRERGINISLVKGQED